MNVGLVQETAEHRSIFAESWICRAFLFASATGMEHSLSNAVRSSSLWRGDLRASNSIIACVDFLDVFASVGRVAFHCATGTARDNRFHQTLFRNAALKVIWDEKVRISKSLLTDAFRFCVPSRVNAHKSVNWVCLLQAVCFPRSCKEWLVRPQTKRACPCQHQGNNAGTECQISSHNPLVS